jgi:predicted alpha/beta superfamily hydrolase
MTKKIFLFASVLLTASISWAQDSRFSLFLQSFKTTELPLERHIYVYLPPGYSENINQRYPVMYMHDGQNLFNPAVAFLGQTWEAEKTLNTLISKGKMKPVIVIGIDNTSDRMNEYTHDLNPAYKQGGKAPIYVKMIANDIKPRVDAAFRTLPGRNFTAIAGSSLGGLVSLYAGIKYPQVFGSVAAFSPSIWWNRQSITNMYKTALTLPTKIYLDSGTVGGERPQDVTKLKDIITNHDGKPNTYVVIQPGGEHKEKYWAERLPGALEFLFQP